MRNAATFLLVVVIGALGILAYYQEAKILRQRQSMEQLAVQLQAASKVTALDLQGKCAKQARSTFKSNGWETHPMASFANHYDSKLNKCFIVIEDTTEGTSDPGGMMVTEILLDAFEGTTYGQYIFHTGKGEKYWEAKPLLCEVTLPSDKKKECQSHQEYEKLVRYYMGHGFH